MLVMKDIHQRQKELKITQDGWFSVWMLGNVRKKKRVEGFKYQALMTLVKDVGEDVFQSFEKKFKNKSLQSGSFDRRGNLYQLYIY